MSPFRPAIRRRRDGSYGVHLDADVRDLLRNIPPQLRQLLDTERENPALRRLFPPAYTDEPELEAEYQRLMGDDLLRRRVDALELMESTIDAAELTEEQLSAWLATLHDFRVTLGTALDVTEETFETELDPSDERAPGLALYEMLTYVEHELVEALTDGLPPPRPDTEA